MSTFYSLGKLSVQDDDQGGTEQSSPLVEVEQKENTIVVTFQFPGFHLTESAKTVDGELIDFKEVGISGAGFISKSGKPLMPSFGKYIQLPAQYDFDLDVDYGERHEFKDILVTPAQEAATDGPEDQKIEYDPKAYEDGELYPRQVMTAGAVQYMDTYKVLPLYVSPLQYSASLKMIRAYERVTVRIKLSQQKEVNEEETEFMNSASSGTLEAFGNFILNPSRMPSDTASTEFDPPVLVLDRGPEFLIIYDDTLKSPASKLALWKKKRGMITKAVAISKVGNSVAAIKDYVRAIRRKRLSRLRYVLLFGDVQAITTEQQAGATTDHYYYTSRDAIGSSDCILPWVSGGRIPVTDSRKAGKIVNQIIRYEKEPPEDSDYYHRMTFAAYFQDKQPPAGNAERAYIKTMESIRNHMVGLGFEIDRIYVSDTPTPQKYLDGTPVPADVRNAIVNEEIASYMMVSDTSEGQMIIGHRDHGSSHGWAHPSFGNTHLEGIVSSYPSIFFSINCLTGQFDRNPSDCFAENLLALDGGAPSLIAATELSGTWRNDSMMKAMFDSLWPGVIPTFPGSTVSYGVRHKRLGDILNYGKSYLLVHHGSNSGVKNHMEIYHVIGDPTLQVWAEEPRNITLRTRVMANTLHISTSSCPRDAVITLWVGDKLLKRIPLRSNRVSIPLREYSEILRPPSPARKRLEVCLAAPDHRFTTTHVRA